MYGHNLRTAYSVMRKTRASQRCLKPRISTRYAAHDISGISSNALVARPADNDAHSAQQQQGVGFERNGLIILIVIAGAV